MLSVILFIYLATILFGIIEIIRDKDLTEKKKIMWILGVIFFNVLAVIAYLIYRNVIFYSKKKYQ